MGIWHIKYINTSKCSPKNTIWNYIWYFLNYNSGFWYSLISLFYEFSFWIRYCKFFSCICTNFINFSFQNILPDQTVNLPKKKLVGKIEITLRKTDSKRAVKINLSVERQCKIISKYLLCQISFQTQFLCLSSQ